MAAAKKYPARARSASAAKSKAGRKSPISVVRGGKKVSITGSRSVAAQSIRRGMMKPKAAAPKAQSGGIDIPGAIGNVFRSIVPQDKLYDAVGNRIKKATKR